MVGSITILLMMNLVLCTPNAPITPPQWYAKATHECWVVGSRTTYFINEVECNMSSPSRDSFQIRTVCFKFFLCILLWMEGGDASSSVFAAYRYNNPDAVVAHDDNGHLFSYVSFPYFYRHLPSLQ